MKYTVDYFIEKFEQIPNKEIGSGNLSNHCALWHCGVRQKEETKNSDTEEAKELSKILEPLISKEKILHDHYRTIVWMINDDWGNNYISGDSPKQRIMNALKKVKV